MHLLKVSSLLLLVACGITNPAETKKEIEQIEYYKDSRTNLCFVRSAVENSNAIGYNVFTYVPCTPEVEKLIK